MDFGKSHGPNVGPPIKTIVDYSPKMGEFTAPPSQLGARETMTIGMIGILSLWFLLSFVIAAGADARGRSPFGWFLLSLIASPLLAALFLLLFPAREKAGQK